MKIINKKYTTKEFIDQAKKNHGDRYDYSLVEYTGTHDKIMIICHKHGPFPQKPYHHLEGQNCPKCSGKYKTTDEFIEEAIKIHGDKYDYSLVTYIMAHKPVDIICKIHGVFPQTPSSHLNNHGCLKCAGMYMDREYFIEKAKLIHGDIYDYSLVDYVTSKKNVMIICPIHGKFNQIPNNHLSGAGCGKCDNKEMDTDEFIRKAKIVHEEKYDYSKVNYEKSKKEISIICPVHGVFQQIPNGHLIGHGCAKCDNKNKTTKEFIDQAKKIHGDRYDYSLVNYVKSIKKIRIICPIHGVFNQKPSEHLFGYGCKFCHESMGEKFIVKYLTENNIQHIRQKTFENCRNVLPLHFDFFIADLNALVEYDGEQHFKPLEFFGGEDAFKLRQINDEIKNKFAKDNNINLLRIRFDEIKEINNILDKNIKQWQQIQQTI